jgi:putative oligomerization/nucleic acid binding protein
MGLLRMAARTAVVAGTATAVSGRVAHRQNEKWAAQEQGQYDQQQAAYDAGVQAAQAQPAAPAAADPNAELQNLANLHAQGVLTDEEFAAAKAKILGI